MAEAVKDRPKAVEAPRDPVAYLESKGWIYQPGEIVEADRWLDPTKPAEDKIERFDRGPINGQDGKPLMEQGPDGKARAKHKIDLVLTPKAWPLTTKQALEEQRSRDRAATKAEAK